MKHKGIICGILAAVCYGTNPFGALPLYEEGVNTASVLFYRFSMAVLMLAVMLIVERKSFSVKKGELKTLASLGALFAVSSITYYQSFRFMKSLKYEKENSLRCVAGCHYHSSRRYIYVSPPF